MFGMQRPVMYVLSFVLIVCVSVSATGGDADMSSWQKYSNAESGFTFMYPGDWEVVDDFFYKTNYVATIQKIIQTGNLLQDSVDCIHINPTQFMEGDGQCIDADMQRICTYSKDADVQAIMRTLASSFRVMPDRIGEREQAWSFK